MNRVWARSNVLFGVQFLDADQGSILCMPNDTRLPLWVRGLNRSRGRALRRATRPWMDDGSVLPDDEGPEASPESMIVRHDDRAISHRQRWERTERNVTTSASRIVSNTRTDAVGDAVMI
jgi:hypothetical protein